MTKPKTLKDLEILEFKFGFRSGGKTGATLVSGYLLKQEAIKWVKELENIIKYRGEYFKDRAESERRVIVFIKQFFNLTEEDLK